MSGLPRKIRRGDLAMVITPVKRFYADHRPPETYYVVVFGVVGSVKRDGSAVNRVDSFRYTAPEYLATRPGRSTVFTLAGDRVDMDGLRQAYVDAKSIPTFSSVEEARKFARPFRRDVESA